MKSITLCCLAGMGLCSAAYAYDGGRTDTIFPPAGVIHRDTADVLLRQTATLSGYSVPGSVLSQAPVADVTNSLSGRFPGLYLLQSTGQPGFDAGIFSLRGQSPTILVNGVPRNYTDIDMNDIESVTVLKDAAATALYGARAQGDYCSSRQNAG
ncbi:TonB-dependent receptor plug domain-containing protein [Chitinophaga pollutisoli]|uniref:TonB-dependent receptor plug domain-containing protein n=1 Tax=Chitinophaga pollutisoli TaxID=3133966 RepID=A0ABZ2YIW9_9BACT